MALQQLSLTVQHGLAVQSQAIEPVEYEGVKAVSFGYAGQGSAIMRGPMVSGAAKTSASCCCTHATRA